MSLKWIPTKSRVQLRCFVSHFHPCWSWWRHNRALQRPNWYFSVAQIATQTLLSLQSSQVCTDSCQSTICPQRSSLKWNLSWIRLELWSSLHHTHHHLWGSLIGECRSQCLQDMHPNLLDSTFDSRCTVSRSCSLPTSGAWSTLLAMGRFSCLARQWRYRLVLSAALSLNLTLGQL